MTSRFVFGRYETMRILIPGLYFSTLLLLVVWAARPFLAQSLYLNELVGVLIFGSMVLVSGLTLYAKETTKKRKAFLENQPSLFIKQKARSMSGLATVEENEARRFYFYLLNNHIPETFHEKIFYFGTIYHIMTQIRRTSFWFGLLSLGLILFLISSGFAVAQMTGLLVLSIVVWLIYLLNVRYNKADRKIQENYQDQIYWLEMNDELVEGLLRKKYSTTSEEHA